MPKARILVDEMSIFPTDQSCTMAKIRGDFHHTWSVDGVTDGMYESNRFELRTKEYQEWMPATLVGERSAGTFDMEVDIPEAEGSTRVVFQGVKKHDIRDARTHKTLHPSERTLMLEVPAQDPLQAVLSVDDCELVTHFFARPSPPTTSNHVTPKSLALRVSQDRTTVTANMSRSTLASFAKSEVRALQMLAPSGDIMKRMWTLQLGPLARHTIQLEHAQTPSQEAKVFKLTVDNETLVEASADDLECDGDGWLCKFLFSGQRIIDFELPEISEDGHPLETTCSTTQKRRYVHQCRVVVYEDCGQLKAELLVDEVNFDALPFDSSPDDAMLHQASTELSLEELRHVYGIDVPQKVASPTDNNMAPIAVVSETITTTENPAASQGHSWTCCAPAVSLSTEILTE
jgi:hypothetical protein